MSFTLEWCDNVAWLFAVREKRAKFVGKSDRAMINFRKLSLSCALILSGLCARADYPLNYEVSLTAGAGSGDFAPYYISSMRGGRFSSASNVQTEASVWRPLERSGRFAYGFGADVIGGYASAVDYQRYNREGRDWTEHSMRPSSLRVQQLYGIVRYRSVFLSAGMREHSSALLNQRLTSGDLVESGNARPIPEVRAGFIDFQDIPLTNGWVQIQGEISYGKMLDNDWWRDHYNYYSHFLAQDALYSYKRCYFRTRPSERLSVTLGMQVAGEFGGHATFYNRGSEGRTDRHSSGLKAFLRMLIPGGESGEDFYVGNHVGSWDFKARYRLDGGHEVSGYFSWPFEDGSGIAKQNGFDGLWGIEYKAPSKGGIVSGALIEYLDFTNQSGPIHFNPGDYAGTTLNGHASGSDDYYNNSGYNSYAYYGQSIGTPALMAPIYNKDGYNRYVANVMRGFHVGVEGTIVPGLDYLLKGGYRKAWGSGYFMLPAPIHLTSVMAEVTWRPARVAGLSVNAQVEVDRGTMPSNAFGAMVSVRYNGLLKL